jgi:glycosyltransferase involved in cell wall biosynthesis
MTARYEQKIHVLPNYLLTEEKTTLSQENRLKQRKLLGFTENDRIFLYSGALFKGRGIDTLLNWCALFPTSWKLCIKGFGPLKNYLHQLANSSLKNRLVLLPPSPPKQLVHDIQFADVGVVPYVSSNRNRQVSLAGKFFEYTAAGLPVMATNIPEIERRIHEHQLGVSLNEFSVSTLTSGGVWLLNNYCQLQKNSLQYAADRNLDQKFKEILCSEKFFPISQVE